MRWCQIRTPILGSSQCSFVSLILSQSFCMFEELSGFGTKHSCKPALQNFPAQILSSVSSNGLPYSEQRSVNYQARFFSS